MIRQAGRPVSRLELVKWAFLLAEEMPSGGGTCFYDFLPYQYGPFSFTLFRETDGLVRNGYLREIKVGNQDAWESVPGVSCNTGDLSRDVRSDALRVVDRFAGKSSDYLVDYVYGRFPWYTVNSRRRRLAQRPIAELAVYTIGYEGCSIDRLLDVLMRHGIQRIVDVRRNPVARRYGFHKSTLDRLCEKVDVEYVHIPEVGIPSELRQGLDSPSAYMRLFERYERELLPLARDAVRKIARFTSDKPTALMCMEADPKMCHRTCVANAVCCMTHLPLHHIWGKTCEPALS